MNLMFFLSPVERLRLPTAIPTAVPMRMLLQILLALSGAAQSTAAFSAEPAVPRATAAHAMSPAPTHHAPPAAIAALREASRKADSSALLVWEDGKIVVEDYDAAGAQPVMVQSITKAIVSLAIGKLIGEGKIGSIDDPVVKYLPEFSEDGRDRITIRHVLTHRSGLAFTHAFGIEVDSAYSALASAIASKPSAEPPGTQARYTNRAWQLLCGVIQRASGRDVQDYMRQEIFPGLGIMRFEWERDRYGATLCYGGLWLYPRDLLKIGLLALNRGNNVGTQVVPAAWFDLSLPMRLDRDFFEEMTPGWHNAYTDEERSRVHVDTAGIRNLVRLGMSQKDADAMLSKDGHNAGEMWAIVMGMDADAQRRMFVAMKRAREEGAIASPIRVVGDMVRFRATGGGGQYLYVDVENKRIVIRLIAVEKMELPRTGMGEKQMGELLDALLRK